MNWGCALRVHIDCGSIGANADLSYVPISSPAPSSSAPLYIGIGGDESRALPLAQEALDLVTSFARVDYSLYQEIHGAWRGARPGPRPPGPEL